MGLTPFSRLLIGRNFSDPKLHDDIRHLPYDVMEKHGKPCITVPIKGAKTCFYPEEVSSLVVERLKNMAEAYLNSTVRFAVITVPSNFNDAQRQMIKVVGTLAGLEVLRVINEPTSSGIAYGMDVPHKSSLECEEFYFVVYDLGAKESNVALESSDYGVFEILGQARDGTLGGDAFDNPLLNYVMDRFRKENTVDLAKDFATMRILKSEVEKAEKALRNKSSTTVNIPACGKSKRFSMTITHSELQELNKQLSERALTLVKKVLEEAKIQNKDINAVIFTGNPGQLAKIQPFLEAYLDSKKTFSLESISPDQAVVRGAAIHANIFSSNYYDDDCCCSNFEVAHLSLGIETNEGTFSKLILRNTLLPTRKTSLFSTLRNDQEKVVINILEGERKIASKTRLLGSLELTELAPQLDGPVEIEVVFELDWNRVLSVVIIEKGTGKNASLVLSSSISHYSEEIDKIVLDAETHYEEDQQCPLQHLVTVTSRAEEQEFGLMVKRGNEV